MLISFVLAVVVEAHLIHILAKIHNAPRISFVLIFIILRNFSKTWPLIGLKSTGNLNIVLIRTWLHRLIVCPTRIHLLSVLLT